MNAPRTQRIQHRDNVARYFLDTEFYEDGQTIDLISIGVVADDGREFYAVNRDARLDRVSDWVRAHVLPQLPPYSDAAWCSRALIRDKLQAFVLPNPSPEIWAYYADYDWVALAQLFGTMMGLPKHFPMYCMDLKQLSVLLGNPDHPKEPLGEHNALSDARWNRDLYWHLRNHAYGAL
jgi:hypothetical protein